MIAALLALATDPLQDPPRKSAVAVRVERPPRIDGRLDDEAWSLAAPIRDFVQVEPVEGAPPSEATEVRLLYDGRNLYVGVRCFDRDVAGIVGTQMGRDAVLDPDDRVELFFDTFGDRRNAFWFQMSPVGSKGDALVSNNGRDFNKPWDGIWEGKASIDELGWSFEMAIPFQTLSFDPSAQAWGMNFRRFVKRRNEEDRWAAARLDQNFFQVAEAGLLRGLKGMRQGLGLDVVPFFTARYEVDRDGATDRDLRGEPGFDAFYRLTPNLTASLTVNTDFAETEVDDRQINLTRFPLFFPEKRDFFLQDAGIFQFADFGGFGARPDLLPFFSRRIGLDLRGNEVPILAGLKLTGRAGDWNLGALDVRTDDAGGQDGQNLFAARVSRNVGGQSTVGGIATSGDPSGEGRSALYGMDANFRTSGFLGDKNLVATVFGLRTETEGRSGDDLAYGASVATPNDRVSLALAWKEIQEDFDPALGFAPRTGIRKTTGSAFYRPRFEGAVRRLSFGTEASVITDLEDRLESSEVSVQALGIEWDSGDELALSVGTTRERLDEPFAIRPDVTIPADEYDFVRARMAFESAQKRPLSVTLAVEGGAFFEGHREDYEAGAFWRPSRYFTGSLGYAQHLVDLPDGSFVVHVGSARANVSFTPDLDWLNLVQVDNESDTLGVQSRLRWIVRPGEEVFLVWSQVEERRGGSLVPLHQEAAFKIGYTLRF